jgi:hypothetical protein
MLGRPFVFVFRTAAAFCGSPFFHIAPSQRIRAAARAGLSIRFAYDGRKHTDIILFAAAVL